MSKANGRPYKPKYTKQQAVGALLAIQKADKRPLDEQQRKDLGLGYHGALHAMTHGHGSIEEAETLALAANISMLFAEAGLALDDLPTIHRGMDMLMGVLKRGNESGRWGMSGPELQAMRDVLEIHDQQMAHEACTCGLMVTVLQEAKRRRLAGLVLELA
jgi:hypothetical protein